MFLELKNVKFKYQKEEIIKNISLRAKKGTFLSIVGPNGSGKTTLIKCINRINIIKDGDIKLLDQSISNLSQRDIAKIVAYVPQMTSNFFQGTVIDLLVMAIKDDNRWKVSDEDVKKALDTLENLDILNLADKNFTSLSGGQKQKVLIAKALVQDAKIYLLDEPTSFLDIKSQIETMKIAVELAKNGKLVIMIVHDLNMAKKYSDRVILMQNGKIISDGVPDEVLDKCNIKQVYDIDVEIKDKYIIPI